MFRRRNQPEKAVDQFLGVAELFLQQGKIKKAFQAYQQILKIAPSSLEAKKGLDVVKNLVRLQKKEEQQVKAKFGGVYPRQELWQNFSADKLDDILQKLSLSRPQREAPVENLKGHYELGVVYREMHLLDAAVEEFQMASQDPSIRLACYQMLKACYEEKGMSHLADKYQDKISHLH